MSQDNAASQSTPPPAGSRAWDTNFLAGLRGRSAGDAVRFELLGGSSARGTIDHLEHSGDQLDYVSGKLSEPEPGHFFIQRQTLPGLAGPLFGVVEFPTSGRAYRIESGANGGSDLVERPLAHVRCLGLPCPKPSGRKSLAEIPPLNLDEFPNVPIPDYQNGIILLESLVGAKAVIYLDFQGGFTPTWGGIAYERPNFDNAQIREIWQRVSEDFLPFNINVTTDLKTFEAAPQNSRQRVIVTPTDTADRGAGGAAYVGSFNSGSIPCWVFVTDSPRYCAQACSHEAGHTLALIHDGQEINGTHYEYYYGHGSGETGWAPIMGVAYYQNMSQWSKGEYAYANNFQDQLAIIAGQNNVLFRAITNQGTSTTPQYLEIFADYSASSEGLITPPERTGVWQFTTSGGPISLRANPARLGPDAAIVLELYDAAGSLWASNNPSETLSASVDTNLPSGTYTLQVIGAGRNDPLTNGFSAYASLGFYSITGSVANARLPDRFSIPENVPAGTVVGMLSPGPAGGGPFSYNITSGNISNTFALDNSGTLRVANNTLLNYEALARNTQRPVQFELFVNLIDPANPALSETNRRVVVAVSDVNEAPTILGFKIGATLISNLGGDPPHFSTSVTEHSPLGTIIGSLVATDPDFFTLLSFTIVDGNHPGMFGIDVGSGQITVAGDLSAAVQDVYDLSVLVSDQATPNPLVVTSTVAVHVDLPYPRGSIAYAMYPNIPGTAVSALTNAANCPRDPAWEQFVAPFEIVTGSGIFGSQGEENLGVTMRGYLLPPKTGDYTFWIASQCDSQLWLSSSTNPSAMNVLASVGVDGDWPAPGEWTKYPSQCSAPVSLERGHAYYIEARMKGGEGTNHLSVAWECASNNLARTIIDGQYLSPYTINYLPHPQGFSAYLRRDALPGTRLGTVTVWDVNPYDSATLSILAGNDEGLFALDPATGSLRVANDVSPATASKAIYTLEVQATDSGTPSLSNTSTVTITVVPADTPPTGSLCEEIWTNIAGTAVSNLTSLPGFPKRPDVIHPLTSFHAGLGSSVVGTNPPAFYSDFAVAGTAYGSRIRAYLTPTNTGPYTFFLSSRDDSELLFGFTTNAADAHPVAGLTGVATEPGEWDRFSSQATGPQWLVAGTRYYIETRLKVGGPLAGTGVGPIWPMTSHIEVGWSGPGLVGTNVIDGSFLSPVDIDFPPVLVDQTVTLSITASNGALVTTCSAMDSAADTCAYRIVSGNVSNTFTIDPPTGRILVADNTTFSSFAVSNFNLRVQVQDSGYGGAYPLKSSLANVAINIVDDSPTFFWSGGAPDGHWSSASNWTTALPDDRAKLTFGGFNQRTNRNDLLQAVGLVSMNPGFRIEGNPLTLWGGLSSRGTNTWAIDSLLAVPQTFACLAGTLNLAGRVNNAGNLFIVAAYSSVQFDGPLSGSGGLMKAETATLTLAGTNAFTGRTTIMSGTLALTNFGTLASSSSILVQPGAILNVSGTANPYVIPAIQTLTGNGTVVGPIVLQGTFTPGSQASGPNPTALYVVSNRLTLAGNTIMPLNTREFSSPGLRVYGTLQCGGTLIVTNQGTFITAGQVFRLFQADSYTGTFATMILPSGAVWDASRLTVDGTLRVVQIGGGGGGVITPPSILPVIFTNGSVVLRFATTSGRTYVPQAATSLTPPVVWISYGARAGNGGTLAVTLPVPPGAPQRYFRIQVH